MGSVFSSAPPADVKFHDTVLQTDDDDDISGITEPTQDALGALSLEDPMPLYRIEHAKSGRSKCRSKHCWEEEQDWVIEKESVRVGTWNIKTGAYGQWEHLACWQVPPCLCRGLPKTRTAKKEFLNEKSDIWSGFSELHAASQEQVLAHIVDTDNWEADEDEEAEESSATSTSANKPQLAIPVPGQDGALPPKYMEGLRFVLTGVFPEVEGNLGFVLTGVFPEVSSGTGKEQVMKTIRSFGGRINVAISGLTSVLVVGEKPSFNKVRDARQRGIPLIGLEDLFEVLKGNVTLEDAVDNVTIGEFSNGYFGNGAFLEFQEVTMGTTRTAQENWFREAAMAMAYTRNAY